MAQKFKVGDKIRRIDRPLAWAPLGFETTVPKEHWTGDNTWYIDKDGGEMHGRASYWELVEASPVQEVTRKEIVPGKYGIVQVEGDTPPGTIFIGIREAAHASQLRAAAVTLTQLADALEAA